MDDRISVTAKFSSMEIYSVETGLPVALQRMVISV